MGKKPVILITGAAGLAGRHLTEYLIENKCGHIVGVIRNETQSEALADLDVDIVKCDLTDPVGVEAIVREARPAYIFHLAAQAYVLASWQNPVQTLQNNIFPALHLFEALRRNDFHGTRIQIAGTSEEYGLVEPHETPIRETNPLRPLSPYGVSKAAMDFLGWQYFRSYGLFIVRTRSFNHIGPSRHKPDASSDWARQIAAIERGDQEPVIWVGNLETKRDFIDVRDAVRAYWLALTKGEAGEVYNICSGETVTMRQVLDILLSLAKVRIQVKVDKERLRPSDVEILLGDFAKLRELTGWSPEIPLQKSLEDMLNFWRGAGT